MALREPSRGEIVRADLIAELVRSAQREVAGSGLIQTPTGTYIRRRAVRATTLTFMPVWLRKVSGVAGDAQNACTFGYNGWRTLTATDPVDQLFIDDQPLCPRVVPGKYAENPEACPAWAIYGMFRDEEQPRWHLWYAPGEVFATPAPCYPCTP